MGIERWDIGKEIAMIHAEVDRIFDSFFKRVVPAIDEEVAAFIPQVNIYNENDKIIVEAALPGVKKEDIDVSLQGGKLLISGVRVGQADRNYYLKELSYGSFEREIALPEQINSEDIRAEYTDGILKVSIPKK